MHTQVAIILILAAVHNGPPWLATRSDILVLCKPSNIILLLGDTITKT